MTSKLEKAEEELCLARAIRTLLLEVEARDLGEPNILDDGSQSSMPDVFFKDADVVCEFTRITDSKANALDREQVKRAAELTQFCIRGGHPMWWVTVEKNADFKKLMPRIRKRIEERRPFEFPTDTLPTVSDDWEEGGELHALGLTSLRQWRGGECFVTWGGASWNTTIASELNKEIASNLRKLADWQASERYLCVAVTRWDASIDINDTPDPPDLPEGIDRLWVIHLSRQVRGGQWCVWSVRRGEEAWSTYELNEVHLGQSVMNTN